jgi:acetyl/propionyl-CoA carboxylase alpha subunit
MCSRFSGILESFEQTQEIAKSSVTPIKQAGGGGKGMRAVWKEEDFKSMGRRSSRVSCRFWE